MDDPLEDDYPDIFEFEEAADDPKLPEAIKAVRELLQQQPGRVFYEKQIETLLEKKLYHWITTKALRQLRETGETLRWKYIEAYFLFPFRMQVHLVRMGVEA